MELRGYSFHYELEKCAYIPPKNELFKIAEKAVEIACMSIDKVVCENYPETIHKDKYGDSVVCLILPLTKSHFSIHTWPQYRHISADLYTCGEEEAAFKSMEFLVSVFKPERTIRHFLKRGPQ